MAWAELLRAYRKRNGLLQKQAAHELGVDVATLSRWERGLIEPSKASKARLHDVMMLGRDPADLPIVKQQARLGGSLAIVNMSTGLYIHTSDPENLNGWGTENLAGECSVKHIHSNKARTYFEETNGFLGMQERGMLSYDIVAPRKRGQALDVVETNAVVIRQRGYSPVIVIHRQRLIRPAAGQVDELAVLVEDDLPEL